MGLSAPTEVVHLSPDVVAISSRQSGFYNQLVKEEKFFSLLLSWRSAPRSVANGSYEKTKRLA